MPVSLDVCYLKNTIKKRQNEIRDEFDFIWNDNDVPNNKTLLQTVNLGVCLLHEISFFAAFYSYK